MLRKRISPVFEPFSAVISQNSEPTEITNDETPEQPIVRQNRQGKNFKSNKRCIILF